ncbi:hypothetical protein HZH68_010330 [Vespula germanica]|uniref:Uncharacterized protein n=1 Tax=Vespula germanica TaxID=30212 RepID=A0A834JXM6_VESGE|nr:hypothetical protein HZH68_010330 [Vespula germanica]
MAIHFSNESDGNVKPPGWLVECRVNLSEIWRRRSRRHPKGNCLYKRPALPESELFQVAWERHLAGATKKVGDETRWRIGQRGEGVGRRVPTGAVGAINVCYVFRKSQKSMQSYWYQRRWLVIVADDGDDSSSGSYGGGGGSSESIPFEIT